MFIEVDGLNIAYKISGSGDDIAVILQGWGTKLAMYDTVAAAISSAYKVVQFDFPGFGDSDEPKEAWNVDAFTGFFVKLMKALDIRKASLIGHSFGGRVIIKLCSADDNPIEVDRIVLIDSAGIMPKKTFRQKVRVRQYKILKKLFDNKVVYALFPELVDDWKSRQGSADYRNATPMMRKCLVMAVNEDLTQLLPKIKQDTLLIWGDKDTATPIEDARTMEKMIPSSGLAVLEGAGHFSYIEKPALFKNIMQSYFLNGDAT